MDYLSIKYIHIISSTILFGTGIGSAFYMLMANRSKDITAIYFATRHVVIADTVFTAPAVILQLITGIALVEIAGFSWTDSWIQLGLGLYLLAAACWLPVVWIQIKMRDMAKDALEHHHELPQHYWRYDRWWLALGSLAFPAVMVIFYLMVFKSN